MSERDEGQQPEGTALGVASPKTIDVNGHVLDFVRHPTEAEAHPEGDVEPGDEGNVCTMCAIARRRDTGEDVLLWLVGNKNWSISRHDQNHDRHKHELA